MMVKYTLVEIGTAVDYLITTFCNKLNYPGP